MPFIVTGWDKSTDQRLDSFLESFRLTTVHDGRHLSKDGQSLGPGSMLLLAPGESDQWSAAPGTEESTIIFRFRALDPSLPQPAGDELWGQPIPQQLTSELIRLVRARMVTISALWWRGEIERVRANAILATVLCDLLGDMHAGENSDQPELRTVDPRIRKAEQLARSRLDSWTVDDFADSVGMKLSAFTALFRAQRGMTPGAWLDEARLSFAKVRLATSEGSLVHKARSTNHPQLPSFGRWFKLRTGISPAAYRKQHLG